MVKGTQKESQAEDQPEADENVRNEETGEEIRPEGDTRSESGIETCVFAKGTAAKKVNGKEESQNAESERQPGGPIVYSKEFKACSHGPIQEGRLFQVTNAIDMKSDPVMAEHDFAGSFSMDGVSVIEERRVKKRGAIGGQPEQKKDCQINGRTRKRAGISGHEAAARRNLSGHAENRVFVA